MSEEKYIPEEKSENKSPNNENVNEHFPEDSNTSKKLKNTCIESQTIKEMEVHHHGQVHHQKKWKESLF